MALPFGYPEPEYGLLFRYGGSEPLATVDHQELHNARLLADVLRLAALRDRLANHAHRLN